MPETNVLILLFVKFTHLHWKGLLVLDLLLPIQLPSDFSSFSLREE